MILVALKGLSENISSACSLDTSIRSKGCLSWANSISYINNSVNREALSLSEKSFQYIKMEYKKEKVVID